MRRRDFIKGMAAMGGYAMLEGCMPKAKGEEPPRLVILYATCSVNKHYLSPYNPKIPSTPNIQALADKSMVFIKHQTESGLSGVSYASLLTGQQAMHHGTFTHPRILAGSNYTIAEAFADNGYDVYYFNSHPMVQPPLNYNQGVPANHYIHDPDYKQEFQFVVDRIKKDPSYKAFIIFSFYVTHAPYYMRDIDLFNDFISKYPQLLEEKGLTRNQLAANHEIYIKNDQRQLSYDFNSTEIGRQSEEKRQKFIKTLDYLYRMQCYRLDKLVGSMMDRLHSGAIADESMVVFTADHGEMLYRDNSFTHWQHYLQITPEVLEVPMMIYAPGIQAGSFQNVSRSIDVMPTIAGYCGLKPPDGRTSWNSEDVYTKGVDLSPVLKGDQGYDNLIAFSHSTVFSPTERDIAKNTFNESTIISKLFPRVDDPSLMWVCLREGNMAFKLAKTSVDDKEIRTLCYDWEKDMEERENIFDPNNPEHRQREQVLREYKAALSDAYMVWYKNADDSLSPEEKLKRIKDLGYL